jgi:hypothetical protein
MSTMKTLATTPFRVAARMADAMTGQDKVDIDTTYSVDGDSAQAWADQFEKNPSRISPVASGHVKDGDVHRGQPFPLGPEIGIEIKDRTTQRLSGGRSRVVLDVEYSGEFEGPGRITITEQRDGTLRVRDEWNDVKNHSMLPTLAARVGHPAVAGLGIQGVAANARGDAPVSAQEIAKGIADTSVSLMTAPFRLFFGG